MKAFLRTSLVTMTLTAALAAQTGPLQYPVTQTVDHVDTYHGTKVPDPYRWLEDDTSPETAKWVEAQNKVTFAYLEQIRKRDLVLRLDTLRRFRRRVRSEEHTSELQSLAYLVCRLLLEKKKK